MIMTESEKMTLRNGRVPWKEVFPNGSVATWFSGQMMHINAPDKMGSVRWSKSFKHSICDNRKYGEHANAVKRGGKWYWLKSHGLDGGYYWE